MKKRLKELFKYENGLLIRIVKTSNNTKVAYQNAKKELHKIGER
mgnify:CR=1 FL=1